MNRMFWTFLSQFFVTLGQVCWLSIFCTRGAYGSHVVAPLRTNRSNGSPGPCLCDICLGHRVYSQLVGVTTESSPKQEHLDLSLGDSWLLECGTCSRHGPGTLNATNDSFKVPALLSLKGFIFDL